MEITVVASLAAKWNMDVNAGHKIVNIDKAVIAYN